jgi:hypothetical protein
MSQSLSTTERGALRDCEAVIERGVKTFVEVGQALLRIRDERLYRVDYKTFEEYCRDRWGWNRRYANRQIEAAGVVENLTPMGVTPEILGPMGPIPQNERQARELAPLPPDGQRAVWNQAVANGGGRLPSAKVLGEMVRAEAKARGMVLREDPDEEWKETPEEREYREDFDRRAKATDEYNHKIFTFIYAIEALSEPSLPIEEVAEEIRKMDSADRDWCGQATPAAQNLKRLAKELQK